MLNNAKIGMTRSERLEAENGFLRGLSNANAITMALLVQKLGGSVRVAREDVDALLVLNLHLVCKQDESDGSLTYSLKRVP
jgi:hypothetical protein